MSGPPVLDSWISSYLTSPTTLTAVRSDMADTVSSRRDSLGKGDSDNSSTSPRQVNRERHGSSPMITILSPPPAKSAEPQQKIPTRLRSDSGLALHTNPAAFRQYTEHNDDGSLPEKGTSRRRMGAMSATSSVKSCSPSLSPETALRGYVSNDRILPDFFEPAIVRLAFSDPSTVRRLRAFAEKIRYGGPDLDFLQHVCASPTCLPCLGQKVTPG